MRRELIGPDAWDWALARRSCVRAARKVVRSDVDAEDAAQEALIRGWRHRHELDDPARYLPWLAQIARREAVRLITGRVTEVELEEAAITCDDLALEQLLRRIDVERVLGFLPEEDRLLVRLRYVEDLTYQQIALKLEMPVGTAKVRLHRLRTRLRALLTEFECHPDRTTPDSRRP